MTDELLTLLAEARTAILNQGTDHTELLVRINKVLTNDREIDE